MPQLSLLQGLENTCAANVNIRDTTPPVWIKSYTSSSVSTSRSIDDVPTLCVWPPNFQYFCWLDVMNNTNTQVRSSFCPLQTHSDCTVALIMPATAAGKFSEGTDGHCTQHAGSPSIASHLPLIPITLVALQILPLYDNCAGGVPIGKQVVGTTCVDSDPRTESGDCVLYSDGSTYNLCVLGWRRTVYTCGPPLLLHTPASPLDGPADRVPCIALAQHIICGPSTKASRAQGVIHADARRLVLTPQTAPSPQEHGACVPGQHPGDGCQQPADGPRHGCSHRRP